MKDIRNISYPNQELTAEINRCLEMPLNRLIQDIENLLIPQMLSDVMRDSWLKGKARKNGHEFFPGSLFAIDSSRFADLFSSDRGKSYVSQLEFALRTEGKLCGIQEPLIEMSSDKQAKVICSILLGMEPKVYEYLTPLSAALVVKIGIAEFCEN